MKSFAISQLNLAYKGKRIIKPKRCAVCGKVLFRQNAKYRLCSNCYIHLENKIRKQIKQKR